MDCYLFYLIENDTIVAKVLQEVRCAMFYYRFYGLTVESDLDFFQLIALDHKPEQVDVTIFRDSLKNEVAEHTALKSCIIRRDETFFTNKTAYLVVRNGNALRYEPKEVANMQYLRTYILGFGFAFLFLQRNQLAIHCSAVSCQQGAFLLAGESGSGKSTLTRALLQEGFKLLADDMEVVQLVEQGVVAYPAFPYQKMCRNEIEKLGYEDEAIYIDEMKDKFMVPCFSDFEEKEQKVVALITLSVSECEKLELREVEGIEKLYAIYGNLFVRRFLQREETNPYIIDACLKVASSIKVYHQNRPLGMDTVNEQVAGILEIKRQMS